jgi:hypothetical protein
VRTTVFTFALLLLVASCSSDGDSNGSGGTGGTASGGSGGSGTGGRGGSTGGSGGSGGGGSGGSATGGSGGSGGGGSGGSATGGSGGSGGGGSGGGGSGGSGGSAGDASPADSGDARLDGMAGDLPPAGNSPITQGFTLTKYTYNIQSPYQVPRGDRYTFDEATNTHTCWVKSNDSSFQAGNGTDPRCELRWLEEWTSGKHMLEAEVWIAPTTDRASITQVFSTSPPTTFMLTAWKDRTLRYYFGTGNGPIIMTDAFDKWFNLKVLHDVAAKRVTVYINDVMSMSFADKGSHWHFKNGVYGCRSERCETRWRNLRYWVKN